MARKTIGSQNLLSSHLARNHLVDSSVLADFFRSQGTKKAFVTHGRKQYGVIDIVKAPEGAVILTDIDESSPMTSDKIADDLLGFEGMAVFVDVEGKLLPARTITKDGLAANQKAISTSEHIADTDMDLIFASILKKASDNSWFEKNDPSMSGSHTLYGPVKGSEEMLVYVGYNDQEDVLQVGRILIEEATEPDVLFNGTLKDFSKALNIATRVGRAVFDKNPLLEMKSLLSKIITGSLDTDPSYIEETSTPSLETPQEASTLNPLAPVSFRNTAVALTALDSEFVKSDESFQGFPTLYADFSKTPQHGGQGILSVVVAYDPTEDKAQGEVIHESLESTILHFNKGKSASSVIRDMMKEGFQFKSQHVKSFLDEIKRLKKDSTTASQGFIAVNIISRKKDQEAFAKFRIWCRVNKIDCQIFELFEGSFNVTLSGTVKTDVDPKDAKTYATKLESSVGDIYNDFTVELEDSGTDLVVFQVDLS